jgi:hypothetical protein
MATFTLGASRSCDVPVRGRDLSALHCAFVRTGTRLRVYDQHSTNGLYAGGRRVEAIDLYPGDTFTAAPVTFLAMNEEMRAQRPVIADLVGIGVTPTPDRILIDAVKQSSHLLPPARRGATWTGSPERSTRCRCAGAAGSSSSPRCPRIGRRSATSSGAPPGRPS